MGKITPCLWFNFNAREAFEFYADIFDDVSLSDESYYSEAGPGPAGELLTATMQRQQVVLAQRLGLERKTLYRKLEEYAAAGGLSIQNPQTGSEPPPDEDA